MKKLYAIILTSIALSACSIYNSASKKIANNITPYKIDIIQGQAITKEQLAQIKIGMTKTDVQLILGSPSIVSLFAKNQWDYVFYYRNGTKDIVKKRQVSLAFDNDILTNIKADDLPSELELVKQIDKNK